MPKNKVAVITGASKGIGKAIAIGLAQMHYQTVLIGRDQNDLKHVCSTIIENGGYKPVIFQLDITSSNKVKEKIALIVDQFKTIDVLVNNAGVYFDGSLDISKQDFEHQLATNLTAQHSVLKEVAPIMKAQNSGYIFNVASRAGKVGFAESGAYCASKFGLVGLSEALYRELNPLGIRVTALCPGWVNTKMAFEAGSTLEEEQMIQPEDLFLTVKWLLSLSPGACVKEVVVETPYSIS